MTAEGVPVPPPKSTLKKIGESAPTVAFGLGNILATLQGAIDTGHVDRNVLFAKPEKEIVEPSKKIEGKLPLVKSATPFPTPTAMIRPTETPVPTATAKPAEIPKAEPTKNEVSGIVSREEEDKKAMSFHRNEIENDKKLSKEDKEFLLKNLEKNYSQLQAIFPPFPGISDQEYQSYVNSLMSGMTLVDGQLIKVHHWPNIDSIIDKCIDPKWDKMRMETADALGIPKDSPLLQFHRGQFLTEVTCAPPKGPNSAGATGPFQLKEDTAMGEHAIMLNEYENLKKSTDKNEVKRAEKLKSLLDKFSFVTKINEKGEKYQAPDLDDELTNTAISVQYLKHLQSMFGDVGFGGMAYNTGQGTGLRLLLQQIGFSSDEAIAMQEAFAGITKYNGMDSLTMQQSIPAHIMASRTNAIDVLVSPGYQKVVKTLKAIDDNANEYVPRTVAAAILMQNRAVSKQ